MQRRFGVVSPCGERRAERDRVRCCSHDRAATCRVFADRFQGMTRQRSQRRVAAGSDLIGKTARIGLRIDASVRGDAAPYPSSWRRGSLEVGPSRKIWSSAVGRSSRRIPLHLDFDQLGVTVTSIRDVSRDERRRVKARRFRVLVCHDDAGRGFHLGVPSELASATKELFTQRVR